MPVVKRNATGVSTAVVIALTSITATSGDLGCGSARDNASSDAGADAAPVAQGCLPFHSQSNIAALSGAPRSNANDSLWWFDSAKVGDATIANPGLVTGDPGKRCAFTGTPAQSIADPSRLGPTATMSLLDAFMTPAQLGLFAYYAAYEPASDQPFGVRAIGFGIAKRDTNGAFPGVFRPTSGAVIWTGDRPSYGNAVGMSTDGAFIYVYGCKSAGPLAHDCYVARARFDGDLTSATAYYYDADGTWTPNADEARPVARAGPVVSVKWHGELSRWVMTYVPTLGRDIRMRTAQYFEGPWSDETTLASCDLAGADPDAFCTGGQQHPDLPVTYGHSVVVSYGIASLKPDLTLPPDAYWPRLVELDLPTQAP